MSQCIIVQNDNSRSVSIVVKRVDVLSYVFVELFILTCISFLLLKSSS